MAKAMAALTAPPVEAADPSLPLAVERAAVSALKKVFLVVAGAAVQRYGGALREEQEVLLALADVAIQIFAAESAVLRAERAFASGAGAARRATLAAAVKAHTIRAVEKAATSARRAAFYAAEGDTLALLLGGIRRFTTYDASGLLGAKRCLAAAALELERFPV